MKTMPECFPCFFNQALRAAKIAGDDAIRHKKVMAEAAGLLCTASTERDPPYIATPIFRKVNEIMGSTDPFAKLKEKYNKIVAEKYKECMDLIVGSTDSFRTAVMLAIAGNIIDFGIQDDFDLEAALKSALSIDPAIDDYPALKERAASAEKILYLADNAGEIGFDRLFIDEIHRLNKKVKITVAVKQVPVINDATVVDAHFFGIEVKNTVIGNGSVHVGTYLPSCSPELIASFKKADLIISKGQANWESLEAQATDRIFFLLKAKCAPVAKVLNVPEGALLIKQGR